MRVDRNLNTRKHALPAVAIERVEQHGKGAGELAGLL